MVASTFLTVFLILHLELQCSTGKHFRIGYIEDPFQTFTHVDAMNKTTVKGATILLLEWMAKRANFTFELVKLEYREKFQGLPYELKTRKLDWAVGNWALLHGRNHLVNYVSPHVAGGHTAIIPYPTRDANVMSVVKPYRTSVWVCFLVSAVIMTSLLICFSRAKRLIYKHKHKDSFVSFRGASSYVLGVATNQGATCFSKARSTRLLAGVWCCAALILVNAYSGSLTTHMTIPKITPLITSLQDLANKSEPQILVRDSSFLQIMLQTSTLYAPYRDNYLQYRGKPCAWDSDAGMNECLSLVQQGRHVLLVEKQLSGALLNQGMDATRTCQLTKIIHEYESAFGASILPLNSPPDLRNLLDVLTMEAIGYGLVNKWQTYYIPTNRYCNNYKTTSYKLKKLSLKEFSGAFTLLGVGIALSFLALLIEHVQALVSKRKRTVAK